MLDRYTILLGGDEGLHMEKIQIFRLGCVIMFIFCLRWQYRGQLKGGLSRLQGKYRQMYLPGF